MNFKLYFRTTSSVDLTVHDVEFDSIESAEAWVVEHINERKALVFAGSGIINPNNLIFAQVSLEGR